MAIVVKVEGDLAGLESKFASAGGKVENFGQQAEAAGKVAADAFGSDLEESLGRIEKATERVADATEELAGGTSKVDQMAEAFGNTEKVILGVNDVLGVMSEQFGVNLGPTQEWAQAAGDVAGGMEGILSGGKALIEQAGPLVARTAPVIASTWAHVTALYAQAAAFVAANAPMLIIIGTLALLAAGVVLVVKNWDTITEKIPVLGTAVDTIQAKLSAFVGWITQALIPGVASLYDPTFKVPLDLVVSYFQLQFDLVRIGIETVLGVIRGVIEVAMGLLTGDWQRAWDGVKQIVDSLWDGIRGAFDAGVKFLTEDMVPKVAGAGRALGGALLDGMEEALGATAGFAGNVAGAVYGAVKALIDAQVIDRINSTLQFSFDTHIPGVGTIDINPPDIPHLPNLARGLWRVPGTRGRDDFPANLAGDEMVVPAEQADVLRDLASMTGGPGASFTATAPGASSSGAPFVVVVPGTSNGGPYTTGPIPTTSNAPSNPATDPSALVDMGGGIYFDPSKNEYIKFNTLMGRWEVVPESAVRPATSGPVPTAGTIGTGIHVEAIENALGGTSGWMTGEIPEEASTMYALYRAGVITEDEMYAWLVDHGFSNAPYENGGPQIGDAIGDVGGGWPGGTPGAEPGATGSPSKPTTPGVANGGGPGASDGSGGGAAGQPSADTKILAEKLDAIERWLKQLVTLAEQEKDRDQQPKELVMTTKPNALDQLASLLYERILRLQQRQQALQP